MNISSHSWYVRGEGNRPAGPFTPEELLRTLQAGRVDAEAVCRREGMPAWLPLRQVEPFASAKLFPQPAAGAPRSLVGGPRRASPPWIGWAAGGGIAAACAVAACIVIAMGCGTPSRRMADEDDRKEAKNLSENPGATHVNTEAQNGSRTGSRSMPAENARPGTSQTARNGSSDPGKTDEAAVATHHRANTVASPEAVAAEGRFANTMAFYEKGSELLELKKNGTFYLDKSLNRAIYKYDARHPQQGSRNPRGRRSEDELLEQGRKGETFSAIDSDGVYGQWTEDDGAIILATGSGMSLRLVRQGDGELVAEGSRGPRWLRWGNWDEDWRRFQERRQKVGIRRRNGNAVPSQAKAKSNGEGPSGFRPAGGRAAPGTEPSLPGAGPRNGFVQIPGVRSASRFVEPPLECDSPSWSPDGKYLMFVARPTEGADGVVSPGWGNSARLPGNIWVVSADGSQRWLVSNFFFGGLRRPERRRADPLNLDVAAVSWSPDGGRIAFIVMEGSVYAMKADATDLFRVSDKNCYRDRMLQWSPDGKRLLLNPTYSVPMMINLDGTETSPLAGPGGSELGSACASRDGTKLAAVVTEGVEMGLCAMAGNSRQATWLTRRQRFGGVGLAYRPRSWSPDARQIAADAVDDLGFDMAVAIFDLASGKSRRLVEGTAPAWSPDGRSIAFEGGIGDRGNLYLIGPDGKNLRRITNRTPPGAQMIWGSQPRCSPDGKQLVFRRGQHVWAANLDGTGETCVIQGTDYSRGYEHAPSWPCKWAPCWKPDGSVVFARYSKRDYPVEIEVCATGVNGGEPRRIFVWKSPTVALKSSDDTDDVCWSPDGTRLAFDNNQNIWVADGDGTAQRRLVGGCHPQWSHDGEKVLFARGSEHNEVLCVVNADGSDQTQITEASDGYRVHHCWSPDGKSIAFEGENGVFVVPASGGKPRRLVWGQQPCWSPDGKQLAFCTTGRLTSGGAADGSPCVYVMDADGTGMRPVMQVDGTPSDLSWHLDGRHLVFEETVKKGQDNENVHHIWVIDASEPVFYQSSYTASELPAWTVPRFETASQPAASAKEDKEAPGPRGKQQSPADEKAADQAPLTGTWQASAGARFRVEDDGKALAVSLLESAPLRELSGKLTRRGGKSGDKSFSGTLQAVFAADAPKRHSLVVTATLDESGQLHLRCSNWPIGFNSYGRPITKTLDETWTRQQ